MIGLILGTGMEAGISAGKWASVATEFGIAVVERVQVEGRDVMLVNRHGDKHSILPHMINYKANIAALRDAGVTRIIATAAVGSIRNDLAPGSLVIAGDFIDWHRGRPITIFDADSASLTHTDFSVPYCPEVSAAIESAMIETGLPVHPRVVYVSADGPRYETPAEIRMFARLGGDVVGMTGAPEAILAKEMGLCYGSIAIVSNFAAGISAEPLTHEEVTRSVAEKSEEVRRLIKATIMRLSDKCETCG
jgi:5'-methylthioadenosine phosphorylase